MVLPLISCFDLRSLKVKMDKTVQLMDDTPEGNEFESVIKDCVEKVGFENQNYKNYSLKFNQNKNFKLNENIKLNFCLLSINFEILVLFKFSF